MAGPGDRGLRDLLHRLVLRVGEVLREDLDHAGEDEPDRDRRGRLPVVEVDLGEHEHGAGRDRGGQEEAAVDRLHPVLGLAPRRDREDADDRGDHADRAHEQREHHPRDRAQLGVGERGGAEDQRGDERDLVGLEQVGGHPRAVADVVADVVGDHGGVARVVLGDPLLDLPDEVGAHVGGLREDAAADPHEHREQRAAEPEPDQDRRGVALVDQEDHRGAEQSEPDREHARHTARAERDLQRATEPRLTSGVRGPHVRADREPHPRVSGERAEPCAEDERERPAELDRQLRVHGVLGRRQDEEQDDGEEREEDPRAFGTGATGRPSRPPGSRERSPSSSRCPRRRRGPPGPGSRRRRARPARCRRSPRDRWSPSR